MKEKFFEKYGIEKYSIYRDFKFGPKHVELGKQALKESQDKGIECKYIHVHYENNIEALIYWYEYHYPEITDTRLLDLLFIATKYGFYYHDITNREELKIMLFSFLTGIYNESLAEEVRGVF